MFSWVCVCVCVCAMCTLADILPAPGGGIHITGPPFWACVCSSIGGSPPTHMPPFPTLTCNKPMLTHVTVAQLKKSVMRIAHAQEILLFPRTVEVQLK